MRDLVMKHKSTVLKLKSTSPKIDSKTKDIVASKQKSVADVKKVLFTDNTPKSDFKFKKFGSDLKVKTSPIKNIVISDSVDDIAVYLDITKPQSIKNTEGLLNMPVSITSDYCSNSGIDSQNMESVSNS